MSRIGKLPIAIPNNVNITWDGLKFTANGKFGTLAIIVPNVISLIQKDNKVILHLNTKTRHNNALYGLYRTLLNNMLIGVSEQFTKNLILKGIGYRAVIQKGMIILNLGYSHPIKLEIPEGISAQVTKNITINLKACDKMLLGLFASKIKALRKPEPYKGKGILFENEKVIRKVGKSAK